ncbi:bifunctional glycosyltransferase family 2 protein/CDP-glycerol:glycerophosphate glycerophosphotransferase [Staphylococcus simiae]|uniref:Teichoic acid biosynthesis protein F n=1 Tax=Staphylococcus simiae CCM 7213 = CCUG 51256 TaxID=911238 RepID=G5JF74_9STAP|nr:bifunctional glycosyltransferase family 2 protein/CDP-glycerol:glycerophosphate glycerophosphotransferase [Staphylococcus simiae]EHJ09166.1 teichoic acid biosynthesis protein F [Staphylococcus simiae CCM 7213 = CCUG 51256]PNZ13919.1 CDP-glycerol:glycerophosphate glycerophosphotransferase [Staphylococcus simiae]SNV58849.1 teichoic acid biosynthesis protein F [Staphylococcus simiae]
MNALTIIVTYYNSEEYIKNCIESLKQQRSQDFNLIIVNDGSTDNSEQILNKTLKDYDKDANIINLEQNGGHAHARNVAIDEVETPYFMFLDADDELASYAVTFYLQKLNGTDGLIAPIHSFAIKRPQYVDLNKVQVKYYRGNSDDINSFLRRQSACNIIFRTAIVKAHHIQFNENLKVYADWSFILEYMKYAEKFIRILKFQFYYRGEVYDPFETSTLTEQDFDMLFTDYVQSFYDAMQRVDNPKVKKFLIKKMQEKLKKEFNPSLYDIEVRYNNNKDMLVELSKYLNLHLVKHQNPLNKIETMLLMKDDTDNAYKVNKLRYKLRHVKNIVLRNKLKNRSIYELSDRPEKVKPKTIVFESFGGKNYSDSPKYIYEYMYQYYPNYNYVWAFKNPDNHVIPGNAKKVKRGSSEYYQAYSEASHWVANSRLPLYLNKKDNQTYIQTWHGTPLKRLANDMKVVRMPGTTTHKYKRNFNRETSRWDYLVSPNRYSTEIFKSAFWMDEDRILEIGYPRNDVLVNKANDKEYIEEIRTNLNIPKDKKVIMYAPTWRDDEFLGKGKYLFELKIDLENLQQELGDDYVVLLRMHYLISNALDLAGYENFAIDVSNYSDISELYLISDCLITDYSSVMFDFGILKRPQFFFAYDIDKYDKGLRGFYMDYMKDLPGPIYKEPYGLAKQLKNLDEVQEKYQDKIDAFYDRFCSVDNGKASQYIADLIHQDINSDK